MNSLISIRNIITICEMEPGLTFSIVTYFCSHSIACMSLFIIKWFNLRNLFALRGGGGAVSWDYLFTMVEMCLTHLLAFEENQKSCGPCGAFLCWQFFGMFGGRGSPYLFQEPFITSLLFGYSNLFIASLCWGVGAQK